MRVYSLVYVYEALYEGDNLLNKKTELISKFRHQHKFMLLRHDSKDWKWRHL